MTPDERSELASLYALSLLEGEDAVKAAALEQSDPAFAAEVAAFSETVATLTDALAPIEPSDLLRERVLALATPRPRTSRAWMGWAAAAVVTLICGWQSREYALVSLHNRTLGQQLAALKNENNLAGIRVASLEGQVEQYKGSRAVVIWDPVKSEGRIDLSNLPAVEAGKDYQLWIVDPAHQYPVSAGLIHRGEDGKASVPFQPVEIIRDASAFAISIEQEGGVDVGKGPIVLVGK